MPMKIKLLTSVYPPQIMLSLSLSPSLPLSLNCVARKHRRPTGPHDPACDVEHMPFKQSPQSPPYLQELWA